MNNANATADALSPALVSARYTQAYKTVRIDYREADDHTFVTVGNVTDAELEVLLAAGGSDVAGWECTLV